MQAVVSCNLIASFHQCANRQYSPSSHIQFLFASAHQTCNHPTLSSILSPTFTVFHLNVTAHYHKSKTLPASRLPSCSNHETFPDMFPVSRFPRKNQKTAIPHFSQLLGGEPNPICFFHVSHLPSSRPSLQAFSSTCLSYSLIVITAVHFSPLPASAATPATASQPCYRFPALLAAIVRGRRASGGTADGWGDRITWG